MPSLALPSILLITFANPDLHGTPKNIHLVFVLVKEIKNPKNAANNARKK